jgi:hypothetical protein
MKTMMKIYIQKTKQLRAQPHNKELLKELTTLGKQIDLALTGKI